MSKAALATGHSALGQSSFSSAKPPPEAECPVPGLSVPAASSFTVTRQVTSVTTLPLVESDLIGVVRLACWKPTKERLLAVNCRLGRAQRCSFQGGVRIQ